MNPAVNPAASERDPRVQQMIENPKSYFEQARQQARIAARRAIAREEQQRRRKHP